MADKQQETEELDLRLPSELMHDKPIHEPSFGYAKDCFAFAATELPFLFVPNLDSIDSVTETETESDDDDRLAGLIQSMAHSFLQDDEDNSNEGVERPDSGHAAEASMTVSLQSLLLSNPEKPKEDKDPKQVIESKINKPVLSHKTVKSPACNNPWQPTQEPQPQPKSAWAVQNKARTGSVRALGLPSSAWPPLQKQPKQQKPQSQPQPKPVLNPEMRTLFLSSSGAKKESLGTGVFIPKIPNSIPVPRRKSACSMVLVPARVVQALNLNLDEFGAQPRFTNDGAHAGYVLDHEALLNRSTSIASSCQKKKVPRRPQSSDMPSPYLHLLPQDWTY